MTQLKHTALADWHIEQGAKMVEFAGYLMPVQYPAGVIKEHTHCRESAALFDVSHMGQISVTGDNIAEKLEAIFPADLKNLALNQQCYSLLLNEQGGVIDDLMICRREADFLLVVNAGCKDKDFAYLTAKLAGKLTLSLLENQALLALQGPKAWQVLKQLGADVDGLFFMQGRYLTVAGIKVWATRSGYTGEDGFELSVANSEVVALANALLENPLVCAAGLGARDSLRLEAGLCLYGHELNEQLSPIDAGLNWAIAKERREQGGFIADKMILAQMAGDKNHYRIGLLAQGRAPVREGALIFNGQDQHIGEVSSGVFSPSLSKPIAMAYVNESVALGETVYAEVRGKKMAMDVVKLPFVAHGYYKG